MVLVNSCIDKKNETTLHSLFTGLSPRQHMQIVDKVFANHSYIPDETTPSDSFVDIDQAELEYLVDESFTNWSFRLVDFIIGSGVYLNGILEEYSHLTALNRIHLLKMLKVKLAKKQHEQFMEIKLTETLIGLFVKASDFFSGKLESI